MLRRSSIVLLAFVFTLAAALLLPLRTRHAADREEDRSGAREALDFWTRSRAYPDADIPSGTYYASYARAKARIKEVSRSVSSSSIWEPIGPINLQGRTLSVAINPQNPHTIYAGTASGGLWRSHFEGKNGDWQRIGLGYPALGIGAIAIDPTDSNTIYLGTGEVYQYQTAIGGLVVRTTRGSYGIGILKSTDNGATWTKSLDWTMNQERGVQSLLINPKNPKTIFAATTEGILKSTDAGANWTNTLPIPMGEDIVINQLDTTHLMASMGNFMSPGVGVYVSVDGGDSWLLSSGLPPYSGKTMLGIYAANPNIVYASVADSTTGAGAIWKTTDFGTTWSVLPGLLAGIYGVQGWYSHIIAAHPTDPLQIFHASVPAAKSNNGGVSFTGSAGSYSDHHGYAIHPTDPNILYVVNDDGIYRSTNFGDSFTNIGFGMQTGQLYNGFSNSAQDSLFAVGQSQDHIPGYFYSGSTSWGRSAADEVGWTAINQSNDNIVYADSRFGEAIYRSTDRGLSFPVGVGFAGTGAWNSPFVLSPSAPNILYFGDQKIYKSTTSGTSFSVTNGNAVLDGNPSLSMAVSATNPDTVYVGTAPLVTRSHLFRTTDGGTTWTNITGSLPDRYPMDLTVDPTNSATLYAALGGFGAGHFFKSTDAGGSWANITGTLPDVPGTAVAIDPLNTAIVYAGNDLGVYVSTNGGSTWAGFSEGLPDAVIAADLVISPSNCSLRIATHGSGVYERSLLGEFPANYFDYRALALNSPSPGEEILANTEVTPIIATFRNNGLLAPPDSVTVHYRILQGGTELYASTKRIAHMAVGESRQVTFAGSFLPPGAGTYDMEATIDVADSNGLNDSLNGSFTVFLLPSIASASVTKGFCPYTEITGGTAGPAGDDVQSSVALPFSFVYDGFAYDQMQISTNGWVELGTGAVGSVRGLSSSGQLGGFFTQALGTSARPTKVLAPWWTDLSTGSIGSITYKFTGSAPNRIATIQWKNIAANYDESSTTMKLNFQVLLFEGTNVVEFHYGPVVAGTFSSGAAGASCGFKDYIGGSYHFWDLAKGGSGLADDLTLSLTPVSNWPGADSCYHLDSTGVSAGSITTLFSVRNRWNIVSVPLVLGDYAKTSVFPTATTSAYAYAGTYASAPVLENGRGYWVKFPSAQTISVTGSAHLADTIDVAEGWNLIGSLSTSIPVASITSDPGGIVTGNFFGYNGDYQSSATLDPGKGYWVKVAAAGELILNSGGTVSSANRIRIVDTGERPPAPPDEGTANEAVPKEFALSQNYPNPFNPTTTMTYQLPVDSRVKLVVYNVMGQVVATLLDGVAPAGYRSTGWNAHDAASGVYFYKLDAAALDDPGRTFSQTRKMLLIR